jgi:hypothetical protein
MFLRTLIVWMPLGANITREKNRPHASVDSVGCSGCEGGEVIAERNNAARSNEDESTGHDAKKIQ